MQLFFTIVIKNVVLEKVCVADVVLFLNIAVGKSSPCECREKSGSARAGSEGQK